MSCLQEETGAPSGAHQDCGTAFGHLHMLCILLGDACMALHATGTCLRAQSGSGDTLRKANSLYITEQDTGRSQPAERAAFKEAFARQTMAQEIYLFIHKSPHISHCQDAAADMMALGLWGL